MRSQVAAAAAADSQRHQARRPCIWLTAREGRPPRISRAARHSTFCLPAAHSFLVRLRGVAAAAVSLRSCPILRILFFFIAENNDAYAIAREIRELVAVPFAPPLVLVGLVLQVCCLSA